jgi:probable F420-dependent oxidoreductase
MEFGIQLPHLGPLASGAATVRVAQLAERLGFDSVWVGDHIVYPAEFVDRFGDACYEAMTMLTWVGASTARIRLGTGVLIAPYRNPLVLGKQISTLDALSGGRMIVGVGVGWLQEEFEALGADFANRGAVTDEHLSVMRTLWRERNPSFSGERFSFPPMCAEPRPAQQPNPPVWIGGNTRRAIRRAANLAEGWFPIWHAPTERGYSPSALGESVRELRDLAQASADGGDGQSSSPRASMSVGGLMALAITDGNHSIDPLSPLVGNVPRIVDAIGEYRESGLDHAVLSPFYGVPSDLLPTETEQIESLLGAGAILH